ncbi:uncharacterized protein LOC119176966 [Rhipicephalus microplus]|uniref:uncharacterized protein LOC119176966 n=1 Tax=Rhipicephalus microplus TaxID=6941 RepID=UPI003F6CE138
MAAARIQRWALLLGAYKYKLQYKPGKFMLNADALSRLPQPLEQELQDDEDAAEYVLVVDQWDEPAVPMKELQALTQSDGVLSSVCRYVIQGWPQSTAEEGTEMREYHKRRNELSVQHNLLHWGHRVVVPAEAREKLLKFKEFLQQNGVAHVRAPPYHPQSNGLAERAVRTIKDGLKKCGDADLSRALARTLCRYRNTPLPSGRSPSEMLLGYQLRTRLDMCFPPRSRATGDVHSADSAEWNFAPGDPVYLRNYGLGDKWTPGKVRSTSGARIVSVDTENGLVHRHMDQLRRRRIEEPSSPEALISPQISLEPPVQDCEAPAATGPGLPGHPPPELRRSTRIKKAVERYGF